MIFEYLYKELREKDWHLKHKPNVSYTKPVRQIFSEVLTPTPDQDPKEQHPY